MSQQPSITFRSAAGPSGHIVPATIRVSTGTRPP